jgi:N-formylglutamate deformylase
VATVRADTDWLLDRLYAFAQQMGASVIQAQISRYVIDLNRPCDGASLYPGQNTTGLCPTHTFRNEALYVQGAEPSHSQVQERVQSYWQPYHDALAAELGRLRAQHGQVLLWEAHSIASVLPHLFEGKLPDLSFGTNAGKSCSAALLDAVLQSAQQHPEMSVAVNGRFKGGYITRNYGAPATGIHAIQLEMCQSLYMDEDWPFAYAEARAEKVQQALQGMLQRAHAHISEQPQFSAIEEAR